MHDIVIRGGSILDGSGADAITGDVAIDGDRLVQVGGKAGAAKREIDADFQRGTLQQPSKPAVIYMMSSHQVLEAFQGDSQWTTGAWHPHVMVYLPHATVDEFALGEQNQTGPVSVSGDARGVQLVFVVPHWVDSPASPDEAADHHDATTGSR